MAKRIKKSVAFILALVTLFALAVPAFALSWDGNSAGGGGGGTPAGANGYAIRYTDDNDLVGYRFSVVNKSGANKVSKSIDVFLNNYFGSYDYDYVYKFSTKYNKKQLIGNQDGSFSTSLGQVNCYKEADMGFATALPVPSGMETWQNNTTNLNKILATLGAGSLSGLKNGDKILVEPIWSVRLESVFHALTVTEIAIYGKYILGASSDGGVSYTSESWGFISNFTNKFFPNSLFTPNGQGLWTGVSAATSRISFYDIINKGYGVGIAYNETKSDFTPALNVQKCEAWPGTLSTRNNNHYGISTGNAYSYWSYGHGYPKSGDKIWYAVYFPKDTENVYVKQSVWVSGGSKVTSRNVWLDSNTWYDVSLDINTVSDGRSSFTIIAREDWIDSSGKVLKYGTAKYFYIPVKPILTREKVTAFNQSGTAQAYDGSAGSSGKIYFGQKVTFQYQYGATTTWSSSDNVRGCAYRWNGKEWAKIYSGNKDDVSVDKVTIKKSSPYKKNSSIGTYTVPLPANTNANSNKLKFSLTTAWSTDTAHTTETSSYYIPVVKSDVEITDMKLVDSSGHYVDRTSLTVGQTLTVHYFYKNNTDCTVYVKGYNDDGSQISGVYAIPANGTIEVTGASHTVPNSRSYTIWGGVYLDTVAKGNTDYESNGTNNAKNFECKAKLPLVLTPIDPNASYREGTDVISSFYLVNQWKDNVTPASNVSVRLRIYKNGQNTPIITLTKNAVVPANDKNLIYFKWKVPTGLGGKNVTLKADVYDGSAYYNLVSNERATKPYTYEQTPDTQYEENAPTGFKAPSAPTGKPGIASWDEWIYTGGKFTKVSYGIAIVKTTVNTVTPETGETAKKVGGVWVMKSGYGFSVKSRISVTKAAGTTLPDDAAYTLPQYGYVVYPEYNYSEASGKYTTMKLEKVSSYDTFVLPAFKTYGKVHFTPLWYPNGDYIVQIVHSDCWTPAGMISRYIIPNTIKIEGSAYDDWYAGRR